MTDDGQRMTDDKAGQVPRLLSGAGANIHFFACLGTHCSFFDPEGRPGHE